MGDDVLGCHWGRPPAMPIGGIPPGPRLLFGGGPRIPGPYVPAPMGPMPGPRGGFILGFIGPIPGGPCHATKSPASPCRVGSILFGIIGCPGGPLKSFPIPCGIRTPGRGPVGYRGPPMNGWPLIICPCEFGGCGCGDCPLLGCEGCDGLIEEFGKKPAGAIGPPGMPSFGGNCPSGLGAGPALCAIPFTP